MKAMNPVSWGTALGAGLFATVALLPQAKGELVYEGSESTASAEAKMDDRATMRQAIGASERAQSTLQAQSQPGYDSAVAPAPAMSAPVETSNYSKSELMRRERQREELKNEDILQERLEELRLRDERRRTQEVLGAGATAPGTERVAQAMPLRDEVVVAPVTETGGKPSLAPAMPTHPAAAPAPDMVTINQSMSVAPSLEGSTASTEVSGERMMFSVTPKAGISNIVGDSGYFQVRPHYSAGLALSMAASDHLGFEVGYTFSQYGISVVGQQQMMAAQYGLTNYESINQNENVFNAGVKLHVLGTDSRIRPYIGGGGAYSTSYVNFAQNVARMGYAYQSMMAQDYNVKKFLGYLSGGMDFKVSKSISVGAEFRYHVVLSANESSNFNNYYNPMYYSGYYGGMYANQDNALAGSTLSRNSFYSLLGNVTFTF